MPIFPLGVPQPLAIRGPFAAVSVDAVRRRVFAAGALSVVVIDADSGKLLATIRLGGARSLAIEPLGGHVFAGTSDGHISEIDPDRKSIVRSLDAGGAVDVLLYDSNSGRLYADGDGRAELATFDARSFTVLTPLPLPGRVPAGLVPDPITRELYVDFSDRPEIAVVDPQRGTVRTAFPTPGLPGKRIVRFDDAFGQIVATGTNGVLDVYDRAGTRRARITVPAGITACDLDTHDHILGCMSPSGLTFVQLQREAGPHVIATEPLAGTGPVAFDTKTDDAVVVRSESDGSGAEVQHFSASLPSPSPSPSAR
jgi:DNA-binding beta-propeller fold protein YncE